jgi:excinuclease ABC subunit C
MHKTIQKLLPTLPGVYFFKNKTGEIIYIGKAKNLRHRVYSYFQKNNRDWKVDAILAEYHDLDFIITKNETEAMLLEADLIQQHKPQFNTVFKDGQPFLYILVTSSTLPTLKIVRNKKEKGEYFGPLLHKTQARGVHRYIMNTLQLNICNKKLEHGCLDYHLGNCPGTCKPDFDLNEYLFRIELAKDLLHQKDKTFIARLDEKISAYNRSFSFEQAKQLHTYRDNVETIFHTLQTKYSPKKFKIELFVATTPGPTDLDQKELQELLGIKTPLHTIDCFDISHFQSRSIVGACVRFTDGKPDKNKFRRFRIKTLDQQNDCAALQEIVSRRYKDPNELPDLILIDGGKGQLNAVKSLFAQTEFASLAKREERLFSAHHPEGIMLDVQTPAGKQLIALRDYTHHFAISYHRLRRKKDAY